MSRQQWLWAAREGEPERLGLAYQSFSAESRNALINCSPIFIVAASQVRIPPPPPENISRSSSRSSATILLLLAPRTRRQAPRAPAPSITMLTRCLGSPRLLCVAPRISARACAPLAPISVVVPSTISITSVGVELPLRTCFSQLGGRSPRISINFQAAFKILHDRSCFQFGYIRQHRTRDIWAGSSQPKEHLLADPAVLLYFSLCLTVRNTHSLVPNRWFCCSFADWCV